MRKFLKWVGSLLLLVVVLSGALYAYAYFRSEQAMARIYAVADPPLAMKRDADTLARGAHLFTTRGCDHCHGPDASGKLLFDAGPVARIVAPNITPGGRLKSLSPDQVAAAIRHGVHADGRPLVFMPSEAFQEMGDSEVAAVVAWLQSLPPSANQPPTLEVRPLGRVLYLFGRFPLLPAEHLDHSPRARALPPLGATVEYGRYLAQGCAGCHGANFAGQHVPGTPPHIPDARNLTPAGIGEWTQADFFHAMRQGKRPDGSELAEIMPWRSFSKMTDVELAAIWAYLRTLPPVEGKKKG